jgi:NADH:ubiquinone reductase (H+-translocating)
MAGMGSRPHVVIVGAGFGGLTAAKRLETEAVDVTLIDRHNYHSFQPLLYQVATAGLNAADVGYAVRGLFRRQRRVLFRKAEVSGVDWATRTLLLRDEAALSFDHLIVAAGSSTNWFGVPGAAELAFPLYGLEDAVRVRNHLLSLFEAADAVPDLIDDGVLNLVIVGGGPTGVEVAGAMAELVDKVLRQDFHDLDVRRSRVILVEQASHLLAPFSPKSREYALKVLGARGVEVRLSTAVTSVAADHLTLADGTQLRTRLVIWAAGVKASPLVEALDVPIGRGGRIQVASDLSIPGRPDAYAVGDVADIDDGKGDGRALPQLAQVAIQGGDHAAEQVLATIARRTHTSFHYFDKGTMATIGRRAAVAELPGGVKLTGPIAWFAWLGLHLVYLLGVRNRVSVFINWAWNYFTWDRGPRLILRPEVLPHTPRPISDAAARADGQASAPRPSVDPAGGRN